MGLMVIIENKIKLVTGAKGVEFSLLFQVRKDEITRPIEVINLVMIDHPGMTLMVFVQELT